MSFPSTFGVIFPLRNNLPKVDDNRSTISFHFWNGTYLVINLYLIKNSQAVKKGAAPIKAMVKKDVKSKVAAKKWL